ncbi:CD2 antigen cytoplasmic tail-binding protein 2 homolog [Diachasma alloeum]|uniref:CD2 antigen cytoplasmic tail-binding protein 2 homolog n=1 Tax=Diachasma alloeum TaxID=454923 RepID=UPI0007383577|nr:CD2 antigen cytoplasmic tail-binding protein 2 homolog [Diachasma alloeum]XP_015118096.1 CD2 antigen cytoplasmic tail-binding protein 2 homolog [Diachasma alloeum]XP_015118097.1 CD2 antigen cytoplasmic tail-binding protein 2 homolog [Diachasma alloeum]XP_015118098.1 CD2 antigen cytoplasmic tail-binding protein 2 homolog [Diachasma alloeum]
MSKRKYDEILTDERSWSAATRANENQHTLDSDEEDDEVKEDNYNVMNPDDLEGTEEGPTAAETNVGFTAFNMKEELEEGHFDKEGHYLWNKEKEIRDNWLDHIDWIQIKPTQSAEGTNNKKNDEENGLADSDSEEEPGVMFDPIPLYKQILEYLKPGETVSKALCRLGKGKQQISSAERWKRKKAGLSETDENSDKIMKLTELANELLTRTGNMDIYQEAHDEIKEKIDKSAKQSHPSKQEAELDMYADDFDTKEKEKLVETNQAGTSSKMDEETTEPVDAEVTWELKWSLEENSEIHGPHTSQQMHKWAKEGYFKNSGWVRRKGQLGSFYSAARLDFELYM